jgi:hypothetical protein
MIDLTVTIVLTKVELEPETLDALTELRTKLGWPVISLTYIPLLDNEESFSSNRTPLSSPECLDLLLFVS